METEIETIAPPDYDEIENSLPLKLESELGKNEKIGTTIFR